MDPHDSPLRSPFVVPITQFPTPYEEPVSYGPVPHLIVSSYFLRHFQVSSYRYRRLIEGVCYRSLLEALYTLKLPTCSFLLFARDCTGRLGCEGFAVQQFRGFRVLSLGAMH